MPEKNFVQPLKVNYNDVECVLTVGSFADKYHRLSLFLESPDEYEVVAKCTCFADYDVEDDEVVLISDEMACALMSAGVVNYALRFITGFPVCRLTEKAKEYIAELEKDNSEICQ